MRSHLESFIYFSENLFNRKQNEQYKGNTYYESYPEILSIEVESWEIITPIGRDYTYEKHGRLIYPTNYLDKYDVEHGDYVPEDK